MDDKLNDDNEYECGKLGWVVLIVVGLIVSFGLFLTLMDFLNLLSKIRFVS